MTRSFLCLLVLCGTIVSARVQAPAFAAQTAELVGVGMTLNQDDNKNLRVEKLIFGGPAERSQKIGPTDLLVGIKAGAEAEWVSTKGLKIEEAVALIRGKEGSTVTLKFEKVPMGARKSEPFEVALRRERIVITGEGGRGHLNTAPVPVNGPAKK